MKTTKFLVASHEIVSKMTNKARTENLHTHCMTIENKINDKRFQLSQKPLRRRITLVKPPLCYYG